ncbi:phospholipase A2-like [Neosynchiropus ocellatus]
MNLATPLLLLLLSACPMSMLRVPRALWQFASMIRCVQPKVNPFQYYDYGCWCGLGGGGTPRDGVDVCCQIHDKCYEKSRKTPGCTAIVDLPYVLKFEYTCSNQEVTCSDCNNKCEAAVCECDRAAAHCFAKNVYNEGNKDLDTKKYCAG